MTIFSIDIGTGNIAEVFYKLKHPNSFVAKLTNSEGESAGTQVWLDDGLKCEYITKMIMIYNMIKMSTKPEKWKI